MQPLHQSLLTEGWRGGAGALQSRVFCKYRIQSLNEDIRSPFRSRLLRCRSRTRFISGMGYIRQAPMKITSRLEGFGFEVQRSSLGLYTLSGYRYSTDASRDLESWWKWSLECLGPLSPGARSGVFSLLEHLKPLIACSRYLVSLDLTIFFCNSTNIHTIHSQLSLSPGPRLLGM